MPRTLGWVVLAIGAGACSGVGPEAELRTELERNESLWRGARPESYVFAVERLCFCGLEARGPVRVRVDGSVVSERSYVTSGDPVAEPFAELFPSVDGIFDVVRAAIAGGADEIRVTYDPILGAPVDVWIDYRESVADEEVGVRLTEEIQAVQARL